MSITNSETDSTTSHLASDIHLITSEKDLSNTNRISTNSTSESSSQLLSSLSKRRFVSFSLALLANANDPGGSSLGRTMSRPPPFPFPKPNRRGERSNLIRVGGQNFPGNATTRQRELLRQLSVESKANVHSENQQFLKEVVNNILDGLGIGWLRINRVKKLMEDENYRNFVLSRLNINLDKRYSDEDDHIEDVVILLSSLFESLRFFIALFQNLETQSYRFQRHDQYSSSSDSRFGNNL